MTAPAPGTSAPAILRRWIVVVLLFTVVCISASGLSGLLGMALDVRPVIEQNTYGLALWLAYALIGGPLAVLLWWWLWRGLDGEDRHSIAWGLYLAAMYTTSLVVFTVNALTALSALVTGDWRGTECATALVWCAIWLVHRAMSRHTAKSPTRLAALPLVLGYAYGLGVTAIAGGRALQSIVDAALTAGSTMPSYGAPWWQTALESLIWAAGGAALWWWHWFRDGVRRDRSGLADGMVLVAGILIPFAAALGGAIALLSTALHALVDRPLLLRDLLDQVPLSVATILVGALLWAYHRQGAAERGEYMRGPVRLVEAGLGLIALASGFGVVLNALLASFAPALGGGGPTALLLSGLSAMLLGLAVWLWAWRPLRVGDSYGDPVRRVYLVVVFGASAVVALVTLLVIAFRVFELVLDSSEGFLERVRAPLGLLVATALVAAYHFAVWRRDRAIAAPPTAPVRSIDEVVLVAGSVAADLVPAVAEATGAKVVVWRRQDAAEHSPAASDTVLSALEGVAARRVLVVASGSAVEAIPLAD